MKEASGTSKNRPLTLQVIVRHRPTVEVAEDLARLKALADEEIAVSDIPEVTAETGWVRNQFYMGAKARKM